MDLAIVDTQALTMTGDGVGPLPDAAIGIDDGELVYVGPADGFDPGGVAETIDGSELLVLPGLVDAHAHTRLTALRGGAQDVPEIEWMNRALAPLAGHLDAETERLGARLGVVEAVLGGATTVCEYAANVAGLVESVHAPLGVRVVATETINELADDRETLGPRELPEFDRDRGVAALERADALFERSADHDRVSAAYGPQAVDMVSPATLRAVAERATERDRDVHIHVAQGERERIQIEARYGSDETAVSVLAEQGLVTEQLLAAHLHGASSDERARLADAGARMVGCPSSIGGIDGVVAPVLGFAEQGGTVGLGTDQAPGSGRHDVLQEARTAGLLTKCDRTDPRSLPAWLALRMATIGGARALGIADRVGTIEEGKRADLALVDLTAPSMAPAVDRPFRTAVPNLVYAAGGGAVDTVLVEGEILVRDGVFCGLDVAALTRRVTDRARDVFEAATDDWRAAGSALVDDADTGRL